MSSPTLTFPCAFCGRRIGVSIDLQGKRVRCPLCKQEVLAPNSPATPAQPKASPPQPQTAAKSPTTPAAKSAQKPPGSTEAPASPEARPRAPASSPPPAPEPAPTDFDNPFAFGNNPAPVRSTQPAPPATSPKSKRPLEAVRPEPPREEPPEITFNLAPRESAESILSEPGESEDEIFGSPGSNRLTIPKLAEVPPPPPSSPPPVPPAILQQPVAIPTLPVPPLAVPPGAAAPSSSNPFAFESDLPPILPPAPARSATQPRVLVPQPVPAPIPVAPAPVPVVPQPVAATLDETQEFAEEQSVQPPSRAGRAGRQQAPATSGSGIHKLLFYLVLTYALLATLAAIYGLFFKSGGKVDSGHPLSTIPDNFGEFDPVSRKKVSQKFPLEGELPAELKADLGGKVEVGQLEIQPVKVEVRPLTIISEGLGEKRSETRPRSLVLHLLIKNNSPDLAIFPMDPAFTRKARGDDKPGTRLVVGDKKYYGAIEWPLNNSKLKRKYEQQQEQDTTALKPGESREYVVFTDTDPQIIRSVTEAGDNLLWRVQVRRGLVQYRGKDIPVTAIIGVQFKAADVKATES